MGIKKSLFKCQCGCNEDIPYSPRHEYPSRKPRYKAGHAHRNKFFLNRDTIEMEYLAAGSGISLANSYGISSVAVYNMLKKMNIELLPKDILDNHNLSIGRSWELFCLQKLDGSEDFSGKDWRCSFDLRWNNFNIDIKVSNPVNVGKSKDRSAWSFNTKVKDEIDYFLCLGLNEKSELEKMFWIPSEDVKKQTTIRRNGNTKYEKYKTSFSELNNLRD
ncbi:hypothetical protein FC756_14555 [Lysinibacillus mangiferihumi]|uniref:Uncharacterized protein n=1 Tax=Lysinibacillus mangiferihumi TaxID=1130819 RepID=A0A4V5TL73_9BACI|nr:hypothetical protein [Lysinibacillus mangiferihumi]TKI66643.1 hypothetical protein FC756_14555 [Lysinibacillus mangiferihumi]